MLKKKSYYIGTFIIGIVFMILSHFFRGEELKTIGGILIGLGGAFVGISVASLYTKFQQDKYPEVIKQSEIDYKDERNIAIRLKAKAKAADITQWFIIGVAYILIMIDAPLWVTLVTVGVFALYSILTIILASKYQKEM